MHDARHDAVCLMRRELPYLHNTPQVAMATFLRQWMRHFIHPPEALLGRTYFLMLKEDETWRGAVWMRLEQPYVRWSRGSAFALEFTLFHGESLASSTQLELHRGQTNHGKAIVFKWPGAGARGKVVVSRLLGMSLMFDAPFWTSQGFTLNDQRLVVHHRDDQHGNCFLNNLVVDTRPSHSSFHARSQR